MKATAYVLPADAAPNSEAQVFDGFPGRWLPGEPIALAELELDEAEAAKRVKDLNLPLKKTTADAKDRRGMLSGADLPSAATPELRVEPLSPMPGLTDDDFKALLDEEPVSPVVAHLAREAGYDAPDPDPREQLLALTRPELDKLAAVEGIAGADAMSTKADVVDAIVAKRAAVS